MSDGCLGYVCGSNKKRLSTEDLDVDRERERATARAKETLSKRRGLPDGDLREMRWLAVGLAAGCLGC
jgi:hypothetical protein